jgi:plastocyanin
MKGFLGTGATFPADLNLVIQVSMGISLLVGMVLARRHSFRAHKYVQSSVMILNLAMIFLIMAPSFRRQVQPQVPGGLKEAYYWVPYVHAALGTIAEVLGLYIVLVAATKILPRKLRFKRYKPWMRAELALWWLVVLIGVGAYYTWYIASARKTSASQTHVAPVPSAVSEKVSVKISNFQFEPKELTIKAGTTVEWLDERGRHTVEADDGSFVSDTMTADGKFEHKFETPGVYPYYCSFHGEKHGKDMAGVITVTPGDQ